MKALHRIRRNLILLLFMLHTTHSASPQDPDFTKCGKDPSLICAVHSSCLPGLKIDKYYKRDFEEITNPKCPRFLKIRAVNSEKVEIEFRDVALEKNVGVEFMSPTDTMVFTCKNNTPVSAVSQVVLEQRDSRAPLYDKVYCKFSATATVEPKDIHKILQDNKPSKIKSSSKTIKIDALTIDELVFPGACGWSKRLFSEHANHKSIIKKHEEFVSFDSKDTERTCDANFFHWYSKDANPPWVLINKFTCYQGKITTTKKLDGSKIDDLNLDTGFSKCSRPKCATCPDLKGPGANFTYSDGNSCVTITCPKAMLLDTDIGQVPHSNRTLQCSFDSTESAPKWEGYDEGIIKNVTCVDEVSCMLLDPINSTCPAVIPEGNNCTEAQLNSTINPAVCAQDQEIWFKPQADKVARQVTTFTCSAKSGKWEVANVTSATNGNVYCLKVVEKIEEEVVAPQKGSAGQLIGIICGVAFVVIIIIIVFVFCAQRHFKKKGNRDEMKSVSVTGRGDKKSKKKKDKKSKSSSSATSEISAPPPPPCPDSLPGLKVEPDLPPPSAVPPSFTAVCPPSSGGASGKGGEAAAVPIVGPDTGKPDKPAELIDIKLLESEKKTEKESSRKSDKDKDQEATLVNTVTGTQSGAEPVKNDATDTKKTDKNDATDTKKTEKHGESSDTGRNTKAGTKTKKDIKKQVDRHGRGLTDDDDYNIDEGAKPVNRVDKNKKPYAPVVDPRKKKINVTMTEDEEGHLKPRGKDSPF